MEAARECRIVWVEYVEGRGVTLESAADILGLGNLLAGVLRDGGIERSEVGGEGGVGVSETVDEVDFVGGVATVGDEVLVVGEWPDMADCGRAISESRGGNFLVFCLCAAASA